MSDAIAQVYQDVNRFAAPVTAPVIIAEILATMLVPMLMIVVPNNATTITIAAIPKMIKPSIKFDFSVSVVCSVMTNPQC